MTTICTDAKIEVDQNILACVRVMDAHGFLIEVNGLDFVAKEGTNIWHC